MNWSDRQRISNHEPRLLLRSCLERLFAGSRGKDGVVFLSCQYSSNWHGRGVCICFLSISTWKPGSVWALYDFHPQEPSTTSEPATPCLKVQVSRAAMTLEGSLFPLWLLLQTQTRVDVRAAIRRVGLLSASSGICIRFKRRKKLLGLLLSGIGSG